MAKHSRLFGHSKKKLGYYPHWTILSSLDYGLPQKQKDGIA